MPGGGRDRPAWSMTGKGRCTGRGRRWEHRASSQLASSPSDGVPAEEGSVDGGLEAEGEERARRPAGPWGSLC